MYHYLKWAALSLFLKRNFRAVLLTLLSLLLLLFLDGIYQDLRLYALDSKHQEWLLPLLLGKWMLMLMAGFLLLYGIKSFGFGDSSAKTKSRQKREKKRKKEKKLSSGASQEILIRQRLERFEGTQKLRRRSDLILEEKGKRYASRRYKN